MDEDHLQHLRQMALQSIRSKSAHVNAMSSTQSTLPHPITSVTVNPLLQGVPMMAGSRLANPLSLPGNMQMAAMPSMGMSSRAAMNPAQLPPPPPPPGPPPAKQGSVSQGMNPMPYSVLGKLPTVTVTPSVFAQAAQTRAGFAQASQTPAGFAQASQPPAGFAQASQPPAGFTQASQPPAGFAQASQTRHNLYQLQGMPTTSPASLFSMSPVKKPQKTKAPSRTPEHAPEGRTPRRGEAHLFKRSRSRSSYSRSASRSRSPRRRSRSSTYSHSRSTSFSTSASDYTSSTSSTDTDSSRSPSPVRKGRHKGRSHYRKDKEKSSTRRKEKEKERRRREKRKRKRRRERSPTERSEQSTPEPGYHGRSLHDSPMKDYSLPSKRPRSDLPPSSRDRRVDYAPARSLPSRPLQGEYSPLQRLSGRLSPRPRGRHPLSADRMHPRMRRDDPHLQMREQYLDNHFDLDYLPPADEYSPSPSRYGRRMSPPPGGSGRDQDSPRRSRPRVGDRAGRGRDGRGDLRRVGQDGRGSLRGVEPDGWDNDFVRSENRWPDIRNEGRRPDIRNERRRLDGRSDGRRPNIRNEGRRPDFGSDGVRMDFRNEGRRPDVRNEGRQPGTSGGDRRLEGRSEGRHSEVRGEGGRRPEMRSEGGRLDVRSEGRRADVKSEGRHAEGRSKHLTGRQGEGDEQQSRRHGRLTRDSRQDERLRDVPPRDKEDGEKKTESGRVSVSEEDPPEGHSGHSHGEESVTDNDSRRDSHSGAEASGSDKGDKEEEEEEEEEEEGVVQSSEEEEEQGEGNGEDSQEQSNTLGWGEDVIELAYDDEFGEEDLQQEQKQPSSLSATRRRSSSNSGGREERETPKGKKQISSPIRVSPTAEEPYLSSRRYSGGGDRNRHHWRQSELPRSLANRLGPKEFRGLKSRGRVNSRVGTSGASFKGSAEEIARRHRILKEHHGGDDGHDHRRRAGRKMR